VPSRPTRRRSRCSASRCTPCCTPRSGTFRAGNVAVKLRPLSATFEGTALVTPDPATRTGRIDGKGADRRGGSRGSVKVAYTLLPDGADATQVTVDADVTLSGSAAQFGRGGLITEMSNRLIAEFVSCVEGKLAATTVADRQEIKAAEVRGFALFFQGLVVWVKGLFGRRRTPA
jgi:carbon monoxide dehydrogenase subunit G